MSKEIENENVNPDIETENEKKTQEKKTKQKEDVDSLKAKLEESNEQLKSSNNLLTKAMELIGNLTKGGKPDPDKEIERADRGVVDWKPGQMASREDDYLSEKIPFKAFKDGKDYKDDITVTVNGYTYQIKRGEMVMIPRFVYHAIENSERQRSAAVDVSQSFIDDFAEKTNARGITL